jgi:hypothetical protein
MRGGIMIIWIVSNIQGAIMSFENRNDAEDFAEQLGGEPHFWINSCAFVLGEKS